MKRGFVGQVNSVLDFQKSIERLGAADVDMENISVNQDFSEFATTLNSGDTVVVISYVDLVGSLHKLFTMTIDLAERDILIESLDEPWLDFLARQPIVTRELERLDGALRKHCVKQGLAKARSNGQVLGRPLGTNKIPNISMQKAINMYVGSDIAVDKICHLVGVNTRSFYRYIKLSGIAYRSNVSAEL